MTQHIGCKPGWTWKAGQPLEVMSCGSCHIVFAIPEGMAKRMRATGASFHCPNGDRIHYHDPEGKRKRLRRQFEDERARSGRFAAQRDQAQAEARGQKARQDADQEPTRP